MTQVISNGSRFYGEPPATIDELLKVLAEHTLDPMFEGHFAEVEQPGIWRFHGNFRDVAHVFDVRTDDRDVAAKLTVAIEANRQSTGYVNEVNARLVARVGTVLMRHFAVEFRGRPYRLTRGSDPVKAPYVLNGARGARYALMRNQVNLNRLFPVNLRTMAVLEGWLTDTFGDLKEVS